MEEKLAHTQRFYILSMYLGAAAIDIINVDTFRQNDAYKRVKIVPIVPILTIFST